MLTSYREQLRRRTLLRTCTAVTTFSEHMRAECIANGVDADRVVRLPAFVPSASGEIAAPVSARAAVRHRAQAPSSNGRQRQR